MKLRLTSRIVLAIMLPAAVLLAVVGVLSYRSACESPTPPASVVAVLENLNIIDFPTRPHEFSIIRPHVR